MAGYDDLPDLIGSFKRAAIDAYMRTQHYPWTIAGGHYEINSSGADYKVTRPDKSGEGGGEWSTDNFIAEIFTGGAKDEEFTEAFDTIRSRIDRAIEPYLDLPDPDAIEIEIEKCRQVTRGLSGAAAASESGGTVGAGVIPGNVALIMQNSSAMSGESISAFKSKFIAQLGAAIGGHHAISIVSGSVLAAEKGIWAAARKNAVDIIENARNASRSLADSGTTADLTTALEVAGWAFKGAGMFFPGGKPAFEVLGLGITILSGTVGKAQDAVISGDDAIAVLSSFEKALDKLDGEITAEEQLLADNLVQNLTNIRSDTTSYDLTAPPVVNENAGDVIAYTPGLIAEITGTYMPTIADELTTIASTLMTAQMAPLKRDGDLGIGFYGPSTQWFELRFLLFELLKDLAWEVRMGARNLDLAIRDLEGVDTAASQAFQEVVALMQEGSPHDPWN
jgi:hypothetical protein